MHWKPSTGMSQLKSTYNYGQSNLLQSCLLGVHTCRHAQTHVCKYACTHTCRHSCTRIYIASNWILISCQQHQVTSEWWTFSISFYWTLQIACILFPFEIFLVPVLSICFLVTLDSFPTGILLAMNASVTWLGCTTNMRKLFMCVCVCVCVRACTCARTHAYTLF